MCESQSWCTLSAQHRLSKKNECPKLFIISFSRMENSLMARRRCLNSGPLKLRIVEFPANHSKHQHLARMQTKPNDGRTTILLFTVLRRCRFVWRRSQWSEMPCVRWVIYVSGQVLHRFTWPENKIHRNNLMTWITHTDDCCYIVANHVLNECEGSKSIAEILHERYSQWH